MQNLFKRLSFAQRVAVVCGALCLLATLVLATVGNLSSRYILRQQFSTNSESLAQQLARDVAPILEQADLISLEVTLRQLLDRHGLLQLAVMDVEGRQISGAGDAATPGPDFAAPITIGGNLAGDLVLRRPADTAMVDQEWMSLGLFTFALLISLFSAGVAAAWAQRIADRLQRAGDRLNTGKQRDDTGDELDRLESSIERLPLDLLTTPAGAADSMAEYQSAGLVYVRLNSLSRYVETLDEVSLLRYIELQRKLLAGAAELYGGELTVCRQFGVLLWFAGSHASGAPASRAAATAWLIQRVAGSLQLRLRLDLSLACGISESGIGSNTDLYPGLYCQHVVDDMAELTSNEPGRVVLSGDISGDPELVTRARLEELDGVLSLAGFNEPWLDLLERQEQLLLKQLGQDPAAQPRSTSR
jgi:hypothetical protein